MTEIEVKDYREHEIAKPGELWEEVAEKYETRFPDWRQVRTRRIAEREVAECALGKRHWRVVLHMERAHSTDLRCGRAMLMTQKSVKSCTAG